MNSFVRSLLIVAVVLMVVGAVWMATLLDNRVGWPALAAAAVLVVLSTWLALWIHNHPNH
jgi:hypothetical protein